MFWPLGPAVVISFCMMSGLLSIIFLHWRVILKKSVVRKNFNMYLKRSEVGVVGLGGPQEAFEAFKPAPSNDLFLLQPLL